MNTAEYVSKLIADGKAAGMDLAALSWKVALACVGWAYVFGARGQYCTPANRRARDYTVHPTIKSACKNFIGSSSAGCKGCKWYPSEKYTRFFDCRGFTYWILLQVYGFELNGAGATSQWNDAKNWKAKGTIDSMPKNTLCCLFRAEGKTMEHTGFGLNMESIDCGTGVTYRETRRDSWTNWAVPACVGGEIPGPEPVPKGYAEVTGKNVALRKDPSTQGIIITRIPTGNRVKLEDFPKDWDYVSYKTYKGWMMREFLREEGNHAIVTGKKVALRQDRCTRSKIYTRVNTGETVQIIPEPTEEWDYVSYSGNRGYMMRKYLKEGV